MFLQSPCFVDVNVLNPCFITVCEIVVRNLSEMRRVSEQGEKCRNIKRPKFFEHSRSRIHHFALQITHSSFCTPDHAFIILHSRSRIHHFALQITHSSFCRAMQRYERPKIMPGYVHFVWILRSDEFFPGYILIKGYICYVRLMTVRFRTETK